MTILYFQKNLSKTEETFVKLQKNNANHLTNIKINPSNLKQTDLQTDYFFQNYEFKFNQHYIIKDVS